MVRWLRAGGALGAGILRFGGTLIMMVTLAGAATGAGVVAGRGQGASASAAPPQRVVSINLCTDQLALLLAAPGQLISVTAFAQDPRQSPLAAAARALPANHARAEEVYVLRPDLVLASDFTAPATLAMLRRLGVRVETFPAARGLADVPAAMTQMGRALGREAEAGAMVRRFDADLAALRAVAPARAPRAAIFEANGYTPGPQSLAGEIVAAAGFADVAGEAGLASGGYLPLERLLMLAPEAVISPRPAPGTSRGQALAEHPAIGALRARGIAVPRSDAEWGCATPLVLDAAARLAAARQSAAQSATQTTAPPAPQPALPPADRTAPRATALRVTAGQPAAVTTAPAAARPASPAAGQTAPQTVASPATVGQTMPQMPPQGALQPAAQTAPQTARH